MNATINMSTYEVKKGEVFINAKGMTLNQLAEELAKEASLNEDRRYKARECAVTQGVLRTPDGDIPLTEEGGERLAARIGMTAGTYRWLRQNETADWAAIVSRRWREWAQEKDRSILVRLRQVPTEAAIANMTRSKHAQPLAMHGDQVMMVRSILSDSYGVFDNVEFLQMTREALPDFMKDAVFSGISNMACIDPVSGALRAKLIVPTMFPGTEQDPHGFGMQFLNNETGDGCALFAGLANCWFCTNQLPTATADLRLTHQGERSLTAPKMIKDAIDSVVQRTPERFAAYWNTRDIKVEDAAEAMRNLAPLVPLGKRLIDRIVEERLPTYVQRYDSTAFAILGSITEWARDMEDVEKRRFAENCAGNLAQAPKKLWLPFSPSAGAR